MSALDLNTVSPTNEGQWLELYAITGAVLGGCSLRGGEGTVAGMLLGAAVLPLLWNLCNFVSVVRRSKGGPAPRRWWCLGVSPGGVDVRREGTDTLVLRPEGGYLAEEVRMTPCDCAGEPDYELLAHTAHLYQPGTRRPYGVLEWPAMLRLLEAEERNSGYPPYWH